MQTHLVPIQTTKHTINPEIYKDKRKTFNQMRKKTQIFTLYGDLRTFLGVLTGLRLTGGTASSKPKPTNIVFHSH